MPETDAVTFRSRPACDTVQSVGTFLQAEADRNLSTATLNCYANDLSHFAQYLSGTIGPRAATDTPVDALLESADRDAVRAYLDYLASHNYRPSTRCRRLASIRSFYAWLHYRDVVTANPAIDLVGPIAALVDHTPRYLEAAEIDRLVGALDGPDLKHVRTRAAALIALDTGVTVRQLLAIDRTDVSPISGAIVLAFGVRKRSVVLGAATADALRAYLKQRPKPHDGPGRLWQGKLGEPLGARCLRRPLGEAAERCGLGGVNFKTLRNTYVRRRLDAGEAVEAISRALGLRSTESLRVRHARGGKADAA